MELRPRSFAVLRLLAEDVGRLLGKDDIIATVWDGGGVASEIINELARNRDLRLIGRDSTFALANQNLLAQELGEQLGARSAISSKAPLSASTHRSAPRRHARR